MSKVYWSQVKPTLEMLTVKYPKAFFPSGSLNTKPLMVGIFTLISGQNTHIPRSVIGEALRRYTLKDRYLRALATCKNRIDLNGKPVEIVSDKHRDYAIKTMIERQQQAVSRKVA